MNVLGNSLSNYICSPRNSAGITGIALDGSDFRLFLFTDNDFCVSLRLPSSTASGLAITTHHGFAGFSEAEANSICVSYKKRQLEAFLWVAYTAK